MEGLRRDSRFSHFVADSLGSDFFTLIDVGCSGGLASSFRDFGRNLRAIGIDPNVAEVERLIAAETLPNVDYLAAYVDIDRHSKVINNSNFWNRLSVAQTLEMRSLQSALYSAREQTENNLWQNTELASMKISLPAYLESKKVFDVDFLKIDVDGADYAILQSCDLLLRDAKILGVGIEVNFYGDADPETNTFHNIDRFMRAQGFALFNLSVRRYSAKALPSRYQISIPAQTEFGRIYQGDALYMRDVCAANGEKEASSLDESKLLKLAALFSLFGMPDGAAEILKSMSGFFGRDEGLDILTFQADRDGVFGGYLSYMSAFARDDLWFWPALREHDVGGGGATLGPFGSTGEEIGRPSSLEGRNTNLPATAEGSASQVCAVHSGSCSWDWTAQIVPGPAGALRTDGSIESQRRRGHVAFGPNQPLREGDYVASILVSVSRKRAVRRARVYIDVAVEGRQVAAIAVPTHRGDHDVVVPFSVGADDVRSGVEVRLHTNGRQRLTLSSVSVRCVSVLPNEAADAVVEDRGTISG